MGNISPSKKFNNASPDDIRIATRGLLHACDKYSN